MQAEVFGIYRAQVTSNVDPTGASRIKVICPQIAGTAELNWAEPANHSDPIPNTGDIVWIYFNGGETYKPVYTVTANPYRWQTPTINTGWSIGSASGTVQSLQYRFDLQDNVVIVGTAHTISTTPGGILFTLPSLYLPKVEQRFVASFNNAGTISVALIQVQTSGNVVVSPVPSVANQDVYINASFPRGNIL